MIIYSRNIRKVLGMITGLFLTVSAIGQNQTVDPNGFNRFFYDSGVLASEGNMKAGKPDGLWKNYYENGTLKSAGNRKDHLLDSTWTFYSEEGILLEQISYSEGKRDSFTITYDKAGFIVSKENFRDDIQHGTSFYYHLDEDMLSKEAVQKEVPFREGQEHGYAYEFGKDGRIISVFTYSNGYLKRHDRINRKNRKGEKMGTWKTFYPNRIVKEEGSYLNNLRHGYFREYSKKGELLTTTKYEMGKVVENAEELINLDIRYEYYDDASVRVMANFRNGVLEGVRREYNQDGSIANAQLYKNGKMLGEGIMDENGLKQGEWKEFYYPEEILRAKGQYKDGVRVGEWIFYYRSGKVEQKGMFNNAGKYHKTWRWYFESGQLQREEEYLNGVEDGPIVEYNDTGKVVTEGEYLDGYEEGEWLYEVGDHLEKGIYKDGQRWGVWEHVYTSNGKLSFRGEYFDGIPEGKHTYYHENGRKRLEGKYVSGVKEGEWKRFKADGTPSVSIMYKNGQEFRVDGQKLKYKVKKKFRDDEEAEVDEAEEDTPTP